jgi:6-phospho-3-hexuloisomerase
MDNFALKYDSTYKMVIDEIQDALMGVDRESLERLVEDIQNADDVFFTGVGRVMMSLEAICKRLTHLGIKAHCVGDITEPAIKNTDLLVVGSGSGESIIPIAIAKKAKELGAKVVHIGSNPSGSISAYANYMVRVPVQTRLYLPDEVKSHQIMTSLFEQTLLILGDVIAQMIADERKTDFRALWKYHANLE